MTKGTESLFAWLSWEPPKHGYYLAAWRHGETISVSELWFNPDANPRWWWSRGYASQRHGGIADAMRHEVVAWMPMPEPPEIPA